MKRVFIACLAVAIAIGAFAFSSLESASVVPSSDQPVWYILTPGGNPDNPADYELATGGEQSLCTGTDLVCAIYAVPDASNQNRPRFDVNQTHDQVLMAEIDKSQNGQNPNTNYVKEKPE